MTALASMTACNSNIDCTNIATTGCVGSTSLHLRPADETNGSGYFPFGRD